jgi:hypothetical protein
MELFRRFLVWWGVLCPLHRARTYWDNDYGKMRCSVTDQPVSSEWRRLR